MSEKNNNGACQRVSIDPRVEQGDVRIVLKDGTEYTSDRYERRNNYSVKDSNGMTIHYGPVVIIDGNVLPLGLIAEIKVKVKKVEEMTVYKVNKHIIRRTTRKPVEDDEDGAE